MKARLFAGLVALACLMSAAQAAEQYPSRFVRFVVPWAPGGITDVMARLVGKHLSLSLGQPVIIENRSGASGLIGAAEVANAEPDGYTILVTPGEFLTTKELLPVMSFDPDRKIEPVALIGASPIVLAVQAESRFTTVHDLLAFAREERVTFASPGPGSLPHLAGEWLALEAGVRLTHVPYRGGAPAALAVLTGEVTAGFMTATSALPMVKSGKLKVLAVMSRGTALDPSWQTLSGTRYRVEVDTWVGMFVPKGTPQFITKRIAAEVERIVRDPEIRAKMKELGAEPSDAGLEEFVRRIASDAERYAPVIARMSTSAKKN